MSVYVKSFQKKLEVERKERASILDLLTYANGIYMINAISSAFSGKNRIKEPIRFFREEETKEEMKARVTKEIKEAFGKSEMLKIARDENLTVTGESR